eukprot:CAMPEP_0183721640 /NCGR_PEP_ID=MMETSP0737-20130205/13846_1 /TAXON_ID=385413 /ORGANISM="Thalassiosira miniscula, Strain CCMP1093" /LENGTH=684 /DNA_ID=CAMNT_0025951679 /DNA_START=89 /DNA_END=2141 /DNA_ORIENTATION=+
MAGSFPSSVPTQALPYRAQSQFLAINAPIIAALSPSEPDSSCAPIRCFASATDGSGEDGDGDDEDEEWLPPDHSPLIKNTIKSMNKQSADKIIHSHTTSPLSPENSLPLDEIEIVDLEATLNNQPIEDFLHGNDSEEESMEIPASEFDVESSNVGWTELLREMRDAGETTMMDQLVQEYKLESYLNDLDNDDDDDDDIELEEENDDLNPSENASEDDEWNEEFEELLQGLSDDEIIDELIENSPSLSDMEMEILSEEMDRGEDGGLDYESFEELDLIDNAAYQDFRTMVLEDYREKRRAREAAATTTTTRRSIGAKAGGKKKAMKSGSKQARRDAEQSSSPTTNFATASDLSEYPPDWKDYDSNAAFQRDFSEDDDSWVPPPLELVLSNSQKNADETKSGEDEEQEPSKDGENISASDLDGAIDWLAARRSRLGEDDPTEKNKQTPTHLLTPSQAAKFSHQNSQIPVIKHTLFTTSELTESLTAQGGTDIHIIDTSKFDSSYGAGIGCDYIMLVTGRAPSHIRVLADSIVRNLKARRLQERNVMGAMQGAEGGQDIFSNKRSRNRARRNGAANTSGKIDDDWIVVDCENIHVHIMESTTRKCLNIEGLWDLSNPNSEGSKLRRVDFTDEEDVDTYVSENPIPDEYAARLFNEGGRGRGSWISGGMGSRVQPVPIFQKKSFSEKW